MAPLLPLLLALALGRCLALLPAAPARPPSRGEPTRREASLRSWGDAGLADAHTTLRVSMMASRGSFENSQQLERMLSAHGVDTAQWGSAGARSVTDLLRELELGESVLTFSTGAVRRWVNVAKVRIFSLEHHQFHLVEAQQLLPDGRVRTRGTPLSEKLRLKESPLAAARRGLREELGALGTEDAINVDAASLRQWRETRESRSYPTLISNYNLHQFDATALALPRTRFETVEDEAAGPLVHVWDWTGRPRSCAMNRCDLATIMWY